MSKQEFLTLLEKGLEGLPRADIEERLSFYGEMIDDRMEEGLSEEEAVEKIGPVETVVSQIIEETPISKIVKEKVKPARRIKAWEIVLIVIGSPLWLSLLIAGGAVLLAFYIVLWALLLALWVIEIAFWACAVAGIAGAVLFFIQNNPAYGIGMLGAGLFCAGVSVFLFAGCVAASKGIVRLTGKAVRSLKRKIMKKGKKES